jgi:hypothetical protein
MRPHERFTTDYDDHDARTVVGFQLRPGSRSKVEPAGIGTEPVVYVELTTDTGDTFKFALRVDQPHAIAPMIGKGILDAARGLSE